MSDSLREALIDAADELYAAYAGFARTDGQCEAMTNYSAASNAYRAALSAPQADAAPVFLGSPDRKAVAARLRGYANEAYRSEVADVPRSVLFEAAQLLTAPPSQSAQMREALEECISVLELVEQPAIRDTDHTEEVHALGERMGYGALMSAASAEWRASLEDDGLPTGGEFVAGPCYATVLATLKKAREALSRADDGKKSEGSPVRDCSETSRPNCEPERSPSDPTPPDQKPWPNGCRNPNSCEIHRDCMYVGCTNYDRDISGEVDAAIKRGGA